MERHASESSCRAVSISPPPKRRRIREETAIIDDAVERRPIMNEALDRVAEVPSIVPSPMQLNFVQDLPKKSNVDAASLGSILGDVMIKECWLFNYLFDFDFVMRHFDPDTRDMIKVRLVHGSWKQEDTNKLHIDEAVSRYANVQSITAYMPEAFGTHHTKMAILFRYDEMAQVVILTGNLIERDWVMSQAIWKTPLLPLQNHAQTPATTSASTGTGIQFKRDLLAYIASYRGRLKDLEASLSEYNFGEVRGALVASVPGKQTPRNLNPEEHTLWGWPGLRRVLKTIRAKQPESKPHINIQVSSVASVGEKWLFTTFLPALRAHCNEFSDQKANPIPVKPEFSLIFPTAAEVRRSVNGYQSGASIHMKTQSPSNAKQLAIIRPLLRHWAQDVIDHTSASDRQTPVREAHRGRAAPHIKTYIRFSDETARNIDWAMVTSANLSTQAWGGAETATGEVRICSYEVGVVVWPGLWEDQGSQDRETEMVPTFGTDTPERGADEEGKRSVGWRMPYDLPLVPYAQEEMPWCASQSHGEPDWLGRVWLR